MTPACCLSLSRCAVRCLFTASTIRKPQPRAENLLRPSPHHATPSPLNGERAGVRGVTNPTSSSRRRLSTPHPSPLLDRGGEGARAGAVLDHARRRALLLPANRQEKHF